MPDKKSVNAQMNEHDRAIFSDNLAHQVSVEIEHEVPDWHRAQAFEQHFGIDKKPIKDKIINWRMWLGVPTLSMACSAFAITIIMTFIQGKSLDKKAYDKQVAALIEQQVLQKVEAYLANQNNSSVETLVNLKLREFAAEQQVILANYRADMSTQQQSNNLALASYVIGASRKERKEDMSDFISFFNAQRKDEQLAQKIKFQQLEREISFKNVGLTQSRETVNDSTKPINYKG